MSTNLLRLFPVCAVLALPSLAFAQAENVSTLPWAYSTFFGTGWYRIGDDRNAFSIRYAPRKALREASINDDGTRNIGIEMRIPVTVGLDHFPLDDLTGSVNPENLANVSVTPSIYFEIPMSERWTLLPFVAAGWGTVLNGEESAWTYWTGVRSRYAVSVANVDVAFINSVGFVGYTPNHGSSTNFWPVMTAVEMATPLGSLRHDDRQLILHWHGGYTFFQEDLDVLQRDRTTEPITDQWEFGFAVSKADDRIKLWRFSFDRLGLSYRFSTDGELQGIGFVFESLFDK
jgi:hypothetical protein